MSAALKNIKCGYCRSSLVAFDSKHTCRCTRCLRPVEGFALRADAPPSCADHVGEPVLVPSDVARLRVVPFQEEEAKKS